LDEDPRDFVEILKRIEGYLMRYMQTSKSNINRLDSQTNEIVSSIRYAREQINELFDVIENEGSRQLLDAILRLRNETHVFLTARQIKMQLTNYWEQIVNKYTAIESTEITLTLHDSLKTLISLAADQLSTVQTKINVDMLSWD
ncbi:hypothetical protein ACJMK2_026929, partial [Sinanodonta woodiana]